MALSGVLDTIAAQWAHLSITLARDPQEAPWRDQYRYLESAYLQNGHYEVIAKLFQSSNVAPKDLRNLRSPAFKAVEFYADLLWPGMLPDALPIETDNESIVEPIQQIWQWSNWNIEKQTCARWFACFGDMFLRVATNGRMTDPTQEEDAGEPVTQVFMQNVKPEFVTEFKCDHRGFLTFIRLDKPITRMEGGKRVSLKHTEVWDKPTQLMRVWEHDKDLGEELEKLPPPKQELAFGVFGIDFVPFVWVPFRPFGFAGPNDRGIGAFTLQLEKIDEANRQATRLHQMLFRHNKAFWGLRANAMDKTNRPLPAPRIGTGDDHTLTISDADDTVLGLPGMSELVSLIPQIDYAAALEVLNAQLREIKEDLPELAYYALREMGEPSGVAVRLLLSDALNRLLAARGNGEYALVRAQQMALTLGANARLFASNFGTFEEGALDHKFAEREVFPLSQEEKATTSEKFVKAGFPLVTAARMAGFTEQELEDLETDVTAEEKRNQAAAETALAVMESRMQTQPQPSSNGTQPEPENVTR